jgi:hypothetical protein
MFIPTTNTSNVCATASSEYMQKRAGDKPQHLAGPRRPEEMGEGKEPPADADLREPGLSLGGRRERLFDEPYICFSWVGLERRNEEGARALGS